MGYFGFRLNTFRLGAVFFDQTLLRLKFFWSAQLRIVQLNRKPDLTLISLGGSTIQGIRYFIPSFFLLFWFSFYLRQTEYLILILLAPHEGLVLEIVFTQGVPLLVEAVHI